MITPKLIALRAQIADLVAQFAQESTAAQPFIPGITAIPPSGKVIGSTEMQHMVDAALDGWLTTGRFNAEFENVWPISSASSTSYLSTQAHLPTW